MNYFDLHCDTITECALHDYDLYKNKLHISLERARIFNPYGQVFAIYIPSEFSGLSAVSRFENIYGTFLNEINKNYEYINFCGNTQDMETALSTGKNIGLLSIEGSAALGGDMQRLYAYYKKGVRIITITWNGSCEAGDGVGVDNAGGLTSFGLNLIKNMADLNMIIDVSHISDKGFDEIAGNIEKPFIASHSNSRTICNNKRNITDEQFKEIVSRKGLCGLNFYTSFIKQNKKVSFADIIYHIEHFLSLGGENTIAIGADFDGASMPDGIQGIKDMCKLYNLLSTHYTKSITDKIFFNNAYSFLKSNLTECESCNKISYKETSI
jgi:membrane dipeptidase